MEQQKQSFYRRIERGYRRLARLEPRRIRLIDGGGSPAEIHERLWEALENSAAWKKWRRS